MKFWFGEGKPPAEFDELVAGDYSVCTIPITGDLSDSTFQQRLQAHAKAAQGLLQTGEGRAFACQATVRRTRYRRCHRYRRTNAARYGP